MKLLLASLLLVLVLVEGQPGERGSTSSRRLKTRPEKGISYTQFPRVKWSYFQDWTPGPKEQWERKKQAEKMPGMEEKSQHSKKMPHACWCVTNPYAMKKCERMVTEFNYMATSDRLQWSCVMKDSKEECMEEIRTGRADIMTAEGDEIYKAGKIHKLIPIMFEKEDYSSIPNYSSKFSKFEEKNGLIKHYSVVLVKKDSDISTWADMKQRKSCHTGVDSLASFKSPMCSLILKGSVPKVGNVYECAGEFFHGSCVPGVQHDKYNQNMTNPESLCKLCKDDEDFCSTLSHKQPYYGFDGALKCLREGQGDVGFFHTYDIMKNFQALSGEFDLLCEKKTQVLQWDNIMKQSCHLTVEHPQVIMVSQDKREHWIANCTKVLEDASTQFKSPASFKLFDSTPYCTKKMGDDGNEKDNVEAMDYPKIKDLIFKDHSVSLKTIPIEMRKYENYTEKNIWKTCEELEPKPRAFFCVVGDDEMKKCDDMIQKFQNIKEIKNISWGCVGAPSREDCTEMVATNMADLVYLNATEMFLAGEDYNLAPIMGQNMKGKDPWTESVTIGVMRRDNRHVTENLRGLKMCNAGVHKISGFLHPMGWLMANGMIKKIGSPLKSIANHFGQSCVPGMNTLDLTNQTLLSLTMDWESILWEKDVDWKEYYKIPVWRKWQDKQKGIENEYKSMHKIQDFRSPQFKKVLHLLTSENRHVHKYHTPEVLEALKMIKEDFSWVKYKGLEDFFNVPVPKWKMIRWMWQMPEDWTEDEWELFMMWAERQWDKVVYWEQKSKYWTNSDWKTFKNWMNTEYAEYKKDGPHDMHQDSFIRLSLLCSRLCWLMKEFKNLQWKDNDMKHAREKLCDSCIGQGDKKCSMDNSEAYYDYPGALKCLKEKKGDIAFIDALTFNNAVDNSEINRDDYSIFRPDGTKIDRIDEKYIKKYNLGRVPSHALVTCNMKDGVSRWKVTKALLHAQKKLTTEMFKDGIFGKETENLTPIPLVNQTYQVWLGPMFLRSMEGIMQPPAEDEEWYEDEVIMESDGGNEYDEEQSYPFCECDEEDETCMEECKTDEPRIWKDEFMTTNSRHDKKMKRLMRMHKKSMMMMIVKKKKKKGSRRGPMMRRMVIRMKHTLMKHTLMKLQKKSPNMHHMGPTGPMKRNHMKPWMKLPMMGYKRPMGQMKRPCMKPWMKKMMGHMGPAMYRPHRMMDRMPPWIENGPCISYPKLRGEFYTKVIFERNGTCNTIGSYLSCYGERKNIKIKTGRVGKTLITVPMCPRPTITKTIPAQFTCDNGASYMKTLLYPVRCSYVPCNPGFWLPDWSKDSYWQGENSYTGDHWGTKDWWSLDKRAGKKNWFPDQPQINRIHKHRPFLRWFGEHWRNK